MPTSRRALSILEPTLAIARLPAGDALPAWLDWGEPIVAVTRTADEISIVCRAELVPAEVTAERDWRALKVAGPLDFAATGVLAAIAAPLAAAEISILALSTYDTDYVLVRSRDLERAVAVLSDTWAIGAPMPDRGPSS